MKLANLSFKNATVKWWRSLTLGFFIFSVSMVMILSSSFILAAKNKVEKVVSNGVAGHMEIRSDRSTEGDMVSQYSQGWDALTPIRSQHIESIQGLLDKNYVGVETHLLARQSVFLTLEGKREETMLIGIDPGFISYKDAFLLTQGSYLDPARNDQILLTEEQANAFRVKAGDKITITSKNMYGMNATIELEVTGIGNFIMLSLFSYKACYTSSDAVRQITGMEPGEATDIILFLEGRSENEPVINNLAEDIKKLGIPCSVTKGQKLESDDLKVSDIDFGDSSDEENGVQLSGCDEMGQTFKGVSDTMFTMLNILIIFLIIIVSILIINLVYMAGLERYREIGTLRAIGFTKSQVICIFMGEILAVSVLSCLAGVLLGSGIILTLGMAGVASPIPALDFIMGKTLNLEIDVKSILTNIALIICFSFAASFYPAYKACSIDPADALRTV